MSNISGLLLPLLAMFYCLSNKTLFPAAISRLRAVRGDYGEDRKFLSLLALLRNQFIPGARTSDADKQHQTAPGPPLHR
jgi:hypothetical protein